MGVLLVVDVDDILVGFLLLIVKKFVVVVDDIVGLLLFIVKKFVGRL